MADIYGSHFEYAGVSSRLYGLIIVNINTSRMSQMSGTIDSITSFDKKNKKRYLIDTDYINSPMTFDIEIINDSERCLRPEERKKIEKWLFGRREYCKLYFDIPDDYYRDMYEVLEDGSIKRLYINCRFINPEKVEYNGGIIGYKVTVETDSNMFWQDATIKTYEIDNPDSDSSSVITVDIDTDMNDYVYPKVTITMGDVGGDIIIANNTDNSDRYTKFKKLSAYANINMNGELNYINDDYYTLFASRNFIRLLDGENKLTIMGNIKTIKFEYSARRFM